MCTRGSWDMKMTPTTPVIAAAIHSHRGSTLGVYRSSTAFVSRFLKQSPEPPTHCNSRRSRSPLASPPWHRPNGYGRCHDLTFVTVARAPSRGRCRPPRNYECSARRYPNGLRRNHSNACPQRIVRGTAPHSSIRALNIFGHQLNQSLQSTVNRTQLFAHELGHWLLPGDDHVAGCINPNLTLTQIDSNYPDYPNAVSRAGIGEWGVDLTGSHPWTLFGPEQGDIMSYCGPSALGVALRLSSGIQRADSRMGRRRTRVLCCCRRAEVARRVPPVPQPVSGSSVGPAPAWRSSGTVWQGRDGSFHRVV